MRCFFVVNDFIYSSRKDASSLAKRVSLLNFEPRVSKFPVLEVEATSNTAATMKSHCSVSKCVSCRIFIEKFSNRIVFIF